jgi:hypothetical protein
VNKTAIQIIRPHHFLKPGGGGGGGFRTNWPTKVVGIATLMNLITMIDSSLTLVKHLLIMMSDFISHFTHKKHKKWLRRMLAVRMKLDKMLKD